MRNFSKVLNLSFLFQTNATGNEKLKVHNNTSHLLPLSTTLWNSNCDNLTTYLVTT